MKRAYLFSSIVLAAAIGGGCVSKSTYDAALRDLESTKAELETATAHKEALTQEVKRMEQITAETTREAEAAAGAARQARDEAEGERKASEERIAKLTRTVAQLTAVQGSLRHAIETAKEDTRVLKSTVERYKARLGEADGPRIPSFPSPPPSIDQPAQPAPTQAAPAPTESVPNQVATAPDTTTRTAPAAAPTPSPTPTPARTSPPAEEGWFSSIRGWLLSIWRSVFS